MSEQPGDPVGPGLRVGILVYRGNPRCGGQGVYTRHLSRELTALGHSVVVFSGPPYPELDPGVRLVRLPSLDLYREPDPFRIPRRSEMRDWIDVVEVAIMLTGGFPEPLTFSLRARRELRRWRGRLDIVHDNQGLGWGLLGIMADGWPTLATVHHPTSVDRSLDLAHADGVLRRLSVRRWYGFVRMQRRVARRVPRVLSASRASAGDVCAAMGLEPARLSVVAVGVDPDVFRPMPEVERRPGRLVATASADVPLKGLTVLLEAVSQLAARLPVELVVVGEAKPGGRAAHAVERLGLQASVTFTSRISDAELVALYASATLAVVPSLYEGFSLPAVEAMACAVALVATSGGALAEVAGPDGEVALVVPPGDPGALACAIERMLGDAQLRDRLGRAGRARVMARYTWRRCAEGTAREYCSLLGAGRRRRGATGAPLPVGGHERAAAPLPTSACAVAPVAPGAAVLQGCVPAPAGGACGRPC